MIEQARAMLARFGIADPASVTPIGGGHINLSWKVVPGPAFRVAGAESHRPPPAQAGPERGTRNLLLQRLNPAVFPDGAAVLHNVALVTSHLARSVARLGLPDPERRALQLVHAPGGAVGQRADDGAWWRLFRFIEDARAVEQTGDPAVGREAGRGFGLFHRLLADYAGPPLAETIPGFHDTERRLQRLEAAAAEERAGRAHEAAAELAFARARAGHARVVPPLLASGELPSRVVHNDAKVANVLLDAATSTALAVIDLDTVMPGTLLYDVGDLIRSLASDTAEDEPELDRIRVRPDMIAALGEGFLAASGGAMTVAEQELFVFSGILLAYEQGVRFLTDYLEGDRYYRVTRPRQNLDRCRAQFRLAALLEEGRGELERVVRERR